MNNHNNKAQAKFCTIDHYFYTILHLTQQEKTVL